MAKRIKKSTRGGARVGAGAKKKEIVKETVTIRLYPSDKDNIISIYGSLQKWADKFTPKITD